MNQLPPSTVLGDQGAFQYPMENNGYSLDSISEGVKYAPELNDGPKGNILQKDGKETALLPNLLRDDTGESLQLEEVLPGKLDEFKKESEEIREEKIERSEIGAPPEVIEFNKKYVAVSERELLPNAEKAILTEEKFTGYFLNPNHKVGGDKALVFEKVLGYNKENWSELKSQIQQGLFKYRSAKGLTDQYGQRFEVRMMIKGPTGRYAKVKTGWIVDAGEKYPRIVSAYIYK